MSDKVQAITRIVLLICLGLTAVIFTSGKWRVLLCVLVLLTLWTERFVWKLIVVPAARSLAGAVEPPQEKEQP